MDLTFKLTWGLLVGLVLVTGAMLVQHQLSGVEATGGQSNPALELQQYYIDLQKKNTVVYGKVQQALAEKRFATALELLDGIGREHPDNPMTEVFRARIRNGEGGIAAALHSYRIAVDLQPDFIDRQTPLYIGEEIMALITEGRSKLNRELKLKPGDTGIKQALEDIYYLQRRIAGGCE